MTSEGHQNRLHKKTKEAEHESLLPMQDTEEGMSDTLTVLVALQAVRHRFLLAGVGIRGVGWPRKGFTEKNFCNPKSNSVLFKRTRFFVLVFVPDETVSGCGLLHFQNKNKT